jgi:hypothetical protein
MESMMRATITMTMIGRLCPTTGHVVCVDERIVCVVVDDAKKAGETSALSHMHATHARTLELACVGLLELTHTSRERTP